MPRTLAQPGKGVQYPGINIHRGAFRKCDAEVIKPAAHTLCRVPQNRDNPNEWQQPQAHERGDALGDAGHAKVLWRSVQGDLSYLARRSAGRVVTSIECSPSRVPFVQAEEVEFLLPIGRVSRNCVWESHTADVRCDVVPERGRAALLAPNDVGKGKHVPLDARGGVRDAMISRELGALRLRRGPSAAAWERVALRKASTRDPGGGAPA
eukprot:CAMPEP_0206041414 /NCGR_PEP_ID=MMETSP1466-20131121/5957_1 /ASSEMBLY_ACC=CAM_ASM_001126 /TAXON_ID=44452 /ORGANISM="Pavlova gyrans, Strain CCMP608" /LENGTH=208 /DNA_ID=CAMNT_0053416111 /DNA_START=633 /DNA_END=1256 /DNA_ORIENTATION=-